MRILVSQKRNFGHCLSRSPLEVVSQFVGAVLRVEEMVRTCPLLLGELTRAGETPFHLAMKAGEFDCLKVLMRAADGMRRSDLRMLLNHLDQDGNTVLDLFYSLGDHLTRQIPLPRSRKECRFNHPAMRAGRAARRQRKDLPSPPLRNRSKSRAERAKASEKEISKVSALLTVCTFVAATAFTCLFDLNTTFPMDGDIDGMKMMAFSKLPPDDFVFLVFNTAAFIGSMLLIFTNTCSLVAKWSPFYRVVPMVVVAALFASYAPVLKNVVPEHLCFTTASQSCSISSFAMVWIYNFGLLSSALAPWFIGSKICSVVSKPSA